jgi:hypothetical protein
MMHEKGETEMEMEMEMIDGRFTTFLYTPPP